MPVAGVAVTDANVAPLYAPPDAIVIPAGEEHKTLDQIARAYDVFLRAKVERNTTVIALGGGVIGDMAGFVAATVLRGVPFVQVPTTLLAMVDASVGGKTGVNHAVGKNQNGAFHQPVAVLADPETLRTLPARELRGGLAECIKHDLIRDAGGFDKLEREIDRALAVDVDYLADLVAHNVAIKARVVEADPFERGDRAHLNFGHTFGHAIETVSGYSYSHGESVALGMVAAAYTCARLNLIGESDRRRIVSVIRRAELPTTNLTLDPAKVVESMAFDKKVRGTTIRLVLLDGIGKAVIRDDVPVTLLREAVESLGG
jgi:3-dehydroquinate synthase